MALLNLKTEMARLHFLAFNLIVFLTSLSMANLIGVLSTSEEYPELVIAVITNPGMQYITVLKHNTVFDTSHLSIPFQVTTEDGRRIAVGGSHFMYSGMERGDLLDLPPGKNFTRKFNMTEYIAHEWEKDKEAPGSVIVSLFPTLKGKKYYHDSYETHPNGLGNVSPSQLRLGDLSKLDLEDIYVKSSSLRFTLPPENKHSHYTKRQPTPPNSSPGIGVITHSSGGCTPEQGQNLSNAILQSRYLAVAAKNAAAKFDSLPFSYFLPATIEAANIVGRAMDGVLQAEQRQGPSVVCHCSDIYRRCVSEQAVLGYAVFVEGGDSDFQAQIVMCPAGLEIPSIITPCSRPPGYLSIAYVLLHELMHIDTISGVLALDWPQPNGYQNARNINANVLAGKNTTTDAAALAMLANWAWDLGFATGTTCMQNWARANFESLDYVRGSLVSG